MAKVKELVPKAVGMPTNVAESLDEETLTKIGSQVCTDYNNDLDSRSEWEERRSTWLRLMTGKREEKTFPWKDASNINVPLLGVACLQFQARAYEALLPSKEIAKTQVLDYAAANAGQRISNHINYQLVHEMDDWHEEMDAMLIQLPLNGSAYKKVYYCPRRKMVISELLGVDEFITPYRVKRLDDAPRKTHAYYESITNIQIKGRDGIFINTNDLKSGQLKAEKDPSPELSQTSSEIVGESESPDPTPDRLLLEQHVMLDLDEDGIAKLYVVTVDEETSKVLRIDNGTIRNNLTGKDEEFVKFIPYAFIPNPDSHYGFGFGHFLEGLNESANTLINQITDAGTLSNVVGGFVSKRSGIKRGQIEFQMGEFKEVDISTDDIRKAIYQMDFKGPSAVLFNVLNLVQTYAREISSVSESMMGELPPADTTATTMLAVMEQGMKVFNTIHKRVHRAFGKELQAIARLNKRYVNEGRYLAIQDSRAMYMEDFQSAKIDYNFPFDVIPTSDPTITSRAEKLIRARQAYELGMQNPLIVENPKSLYRLTKDFMEALEVAGVDEIVQMPPPPPEPEDLPPEMENAGFLQETGATVLPQQNHAEHLETHQAFADSHWGEQLTPHGKNLLDAHIRETMSALYLMEIEQDQQPEMGMEGGEIGGFEGMEGLEGGEAIPPEFEGITANPFEGLVEGDELGEVLGGAREIV